MIYFAVCRYTQIINYETKCYLILPEDDGCVGKAVSLYSDDPSQIPHCKNEERKTDLVVITSLNPGCHESHWGLEVSLVSPYH